MTASEIEVLVNGRHGDAFRVLGPHLLEPSAVSERWEVRAFLPHAQAASVIIGSHEHAMRRKHNGGVFETRLAGEPEAYRLRLTRWDGTVEDIEDPYRFPPLLSDFEIHLHGEGTNYESYRTLGAHLVECEGVAGVRFAVWAPNAESVAVTGDFNDWDTRRHPMRRRNGGIWELFLPAMQIGATYKYHVRSMVRGYEQMKSDPYAFATEVPPKSASVVWNLEQYQWQDDEWMQHRASTDWLKQPISVYEVHLESWLKGPGFTFLTYREFASKLVAYVKRMGYTHVELLPIMEHPFSGSWGYQVTGYFAPTSRFGTPEDFMYFVDHCHQAGIGVIVDWVPAHFPKDSHGLAFFDGTALYEHDDPRKGEHRDWGTLIFNFGRNEVREFLIANALFWLKQYHVDGLRVDAVASMLYLDYSRKEGDWVPNVFGGRENLEAIDFLRRFNELVHQVPGALTFAEESTSFPGVSRPVYLNGLGFTMKWNMGWMHDMLHYFEQNPVHRKYNHNDVTFSLLYAFTENFVLPISHDEVVHGKGSLLAKMPGDMWQQFANCRAFFAFMYTHPGKKLLFMGTEIGQWNEWNNYGSVEWDLLQFPLHSGLQTLVRELNHFYRQQKALYEVDFHWSGFEWLDFRDVENSIISFIRRAEDPNEFLIVCCNFTPVVRHNYGLGVPEPGFYEAVFNTDAPAYGGSNVHNGHGAQAYPTEMHGRSHSIYISLPPLAVVVFKLVRPVVEDLPLAQAEPVLITQSAAADSVAQS
jgi:1,4-alpha-glucan branching enzyme